MCFIKTYLVNTLIQRCGDELGQLMDSSRLQFPARWPMKRPDAGINHHQPTVLQLMEDHFAPPNVIVMTWLLILFTSAALDAAALP